MSLIGRLKKLLWGTNGYDPEKHETQVRKIKDESFGAMDATGANFAELGRQFEAPVIDPGPIESEKPRKDEPLCQDGRRP